MSKQLYLKKIQGKGRGVFCRQRLIPNEMIEVAPLLIIPAEQKTLITQSKLADYFFNYCTDDEPASALALGFGSLYNHAQFSNADYRIDYESNCIEFFAIENILPDTEICINYGGEYAKDYTEWFACRNIKYKI
ncbi:MAG: SET domain-containing protein-lysine N-methyltransferase [Chitinophagaceae bacterium]|nr:SET domain-containing protein-lysine N-methyltransferase [Chitinophagaceae bacterium]